MCNSKGIKCDIKVAEIKNGYQVQITGNDVKGVLKPENIKKCIQACCSGDAPFKDICCP